MAKPRDLPATVYIPEGFPQPGAEYKKVQCDLAWDLEHLQDRKCFACGEPLLHGSMIDIHEAIVTKGDVQGWPNNWKIIIINKYNCVAVHRQCHQHGMREQAWKAKCELFGKEEMEKWYYSLPWKIGPPRRFE